MNDPLTVGLGIAFVGLVVVVVAVFPPGWLQDWWNR